VEQRRADRGKAAPRKLRGYDVATLRVNMPPQADIRRIGQQSGKRKLDGPSDLN
jgi:hypothetical protein